MVDSLETHRFTFDSANENMFPPTRLKMAMGALFMLREFLSYNMVPKLL